MVSNKADQKGETDMTHAEMIAHNNALGKMTKAQRLTNKIQRFSDAVASGAYQYSRARPSQFSVGGYSVSAYSRESGFSKLLTELDSFYADRILEAHGKVSPISPTEKA